MKVRAARWMDRLAGAIGVLLAVGIGLHLTIKDEVDVIAPLIYALPLPIIVIGLFGLAGWWQMRGKGRWAILILVSALGVGGFWWRVSFNHFENGAGSGISGKGGIGLAFWNIAHNDDPIESLTKWIQGNDVDVVAMVEVGDISNEVCEQYRSLLPGYQVKGLSQGMALFCRGEIGEVTMVKLPNRSAANLIEVNLGSQKLPLRLVITDIGPDPFYSRREVLEAVLEFAGTEMRTAVVGDFNTPYESVHFEPYAENFHHAWRAAGESYRETWPWFAPVLCIDHLWLSTDLVATSAERRNCWSSDHSLILVRAVFDEEIE